MNIAIITYSLNSGGVETVIKNLYDHFKTNHSITIIETNNKGTHSDYFKNKGYNVKTIDIGFFESRKSHIKRLASHFNSHDYDVAFTNYAPFFHRCLDFISKNLRVFSILHSELNCVINAGLYNINKIEKVVCVSDGVKTNAILDNDSIKNKTIVIPNGVYVPDYWKKENYNFLSKKVNIVYFGRVTEEKGIFLIPDIINQCISGGVDLHLKIIGDGIALEKLKKVMLEKGLDKYVDYTGHIEQKEAHNLLEQQDIIILPSYNEGQGLTYIEGMARGLVPIVSSIKGVTDNVIKNNENGYLCTIGDPKDFSSKIISLYKNRNLMKDISFNAWQHSDKFNICKMSKEYDNLINNKDYIQHSSYKINKNKFNLLDHIPFIFIKTNRLVKSVLKKILVVLRRTY
ncbi:glycosyltransferase family 4 protein [Vibrio sp. Of7-15]|uniref:glycosyltransferase family 4 protein n=1 Tax=Vibrio sp. Of7-15 TaxID=2724879 RepID=UPI001EF3CBB9|nr:glycosyltransferase family 4 protein [Vibrio sp. Of7-15]MCG7498503.1 glycosyltransferase family 4 protein [Vibrio sp. Of7-15]